MADVVINRDERTQQQKVAGDIGEYYELDGYWCLDTDKKVAIPEGHADARFVLGGPGSRIPMADAIAYGLVGGPEPEPAPAPKKSKAKAEPPADSQ